VAVQDEIGVGEIEEGVRPAAACIALGAARRRWEGGGAADGGSDAGGVRGGWRHSRDGGASTLADGGA
jgi:hypothetical protein